MGLSDKIKKDIQDKKKQKIENVNHFKEQILITDALKEDYDNAVISIDKDIFTDITTVNNTLVGVQSAYQNRINSGCRTDLFWTITSYTPGSSGPPPTSASYTLECKRLTTTGYGVSISYVDSSGGITTYSADTRIITGVTPDNLHGLKYYDQPYLRDIGDTTIGSFIGVVGAASTILAIVSQSSQDLVTSFEVGNLVICSKDGVFSSGSNKIVGFGTTTISGISTSVMEDVVGIATTSLTVASIILQSATVGFSSLPESDGSYVDFTIVTDTETFSEENARFKYQVKFTKNPFSPEKIGILTSGTLGKGRKIEYDNSGKQSAEQSWKPELEGIERGGEEIREPVVGSGKIYYIVGFADKPISPFTGNPVNEGDNITVSSLFGIYSAISPPAGCTAIENQLTSAISARNSAESALSSGSNCIEKKIDAANAMRKERKEYSLKIWGLRQSIGGESDRVDDYEVLEAYINDTEDVIDGTGTTSCL